MGAVHGVYLKYVGLSALSYAGYTWIMKDSSSGERLSLWELLGTTSQALLSGSPSASASFWRVAGAVVLGYSAVLNGSIAVLFKLEQGMGILGKNRKTGEIPLWSYLLFFPFYLPTYLYTYIHTLTGRQRIVQKDGAVVDDIVPVASEVQPGWWIGGCHADELHQDWAAVIDLTVEFPESTIDHTRAYLSIPTWDGVPASPDQLEEAANFAVAAKSMAGGGDGGDILVHCAHGRGRSTTVMCACLVKAGLFSDWKEAFEKGIKPRRPCCKLNARMRENLEAWQINYVESRNKKGQ